MIGDVPPPVDFLGKIKEEDLSRKSRPSFRWRSSLDIFARLTVTASVFPFSREYVRDPRVY